VRQLDLTGPYLAAARANGPPSRKEREKIIARMTARTR
jgi:hypothetical protein